MMAARHSCALKTSAKAINPASITSSRSPAHEQVVAVADTADRDSTQIGVQFHDRPPLLRSMTIASIGSVAAISAPRPKKLLIMFCAPTRKASTSTMKIRVRKNPLKSPPITNAPPATTMPIIESENATGPVTELRRFMSQLS